MQQLLILQFICFLLQVVKAIHDAAITNIQDYSKPNYANDSELWHQMSAISYGLVVVIICYITQHWAWAIPLFLVRLVFFSPLYQAIRTEKKGIFYLSDKGFDGQLKKYLGKNAGIIQFICGIIVLLSVNYFIYLNGY